MNPNSRIELGLVALLIILFSQNVCAQGNETKNKLPDSNQASFRVDSRNFWKEELSDISSDFIRMDWVHSGGIHTTSPTCTSALFNLEGYTELQNRVTGEGNVSINYGGPDAQGGCGNDTCFVVASPSGEPTLAGNTFRRIGTTNLYVNCSTDVLTAFPPDTVKLMKVTLSGGAISAVQDLRNPSSYPRRGTFALDDPLYGGRCDGATDNTPILNSIISRLDGKQAIISIPSGTCNFNSMPNQTNNGILLMGEGPLATTLFRNFSQNELSPGFLEMPGMNMLTITSGTSTQRYGLANGGRVLAGRLTPTKNGASLETNDGITFPANPPVFTNANTLDRYEKGTFVPTVRGTTVIGTGTYSWQVGKYVRIGPLLIYDIALAWTAHTGSGLLEIVGFPVGQSLTTGYNSMGPAWVSGGPITGGPYNPQFLLTNTILKMFNYHGDTGAVGQINLTSTGSLVLSGQYFTD